MSLRSLSFDQYPAVLEANRVYQPLAITYTAIEDLEIRDYLTVRPSLALH
jgi:hypothetical protein